MKNWDNLEPDIYKLMNKHFTHGRRMKLDRIYIHHNAGVLTVDDIWRVWQDRQASAHYQITPSGLIGQLVNDVDTAWHAGNETENNRSIGIEHSNIAGPNYPISEKTREEGAHLVAAICHYYKLGRPAWRVNVFPHSDASSTGCPGRLAPNGEYGAAYIKRAQEWYDSISKGNKPVDNNNKAPSQLDRIENRATDIWLQQGNGNGYTGFEQGGNRSLYDLMAAVGEKLGISGCKDTKK